MSNPDFDIVAALYEAWNTRDIAAWVDSFTPDATWTNLPPERSMRATTGWRTTTGTGTGRSATERARS